MARKKTETPKMPATEVQGKFVRLQLPPAEHKQLRQLAAAEESNMATLARRIVLEYLARHAPKGGK